MSESMDLFDRSKYADVGFAAHWIAITLAAALTLFGLVITVAVGRALANDPVLYRSFAFLCMCQAVVDAMLLVMIGTVLIPTWAIREPVEDYSIRVYIVTCSTALFYTQAGLIALIAFNRCLGITKPMLYAKLFNEQNCPKLVFLCMFAIGSCGNTFPNPGPKYVTYLGAVYGLGVFLYKVPCPYWLDVEHYVIAYDMRDESYACGMQVIVLSYVHAAPILVLGVGSTIVSIKALYTQADRLTNTSAKKLARQRRTLQQSAINLAWQVFCLGLFNIASPLLVHFFDLRLIILFTNTMIWASGHMFNSVVLFVYNPSIRRAAFCKAETKVVPSRGTVTAVTTEL